MLVKDVLEKNIQQMPNVLFAYLFGSYADASQTKQSDVDLALYLSDTSLDVKLQIIYQLSKALNKEVDLVVLNDVKNIYLLETILQKGILLKDNTQRVDFELTKQHEILDYKSFKKMLDVA